MATDCKAFHHSNSLLPSTLTSGLWWVGRPIGYSFVCQFFHCLFANNCGTVYCESVKLLFYFSKANMETNKDSMTEFITHLLSGVVSYCHISLGFCDINSYCCRT